MSQFLAFIGTLFGVLFAFYLSNLAENTKAQKRLDIAQNYIIEEIKTNYLHTSEHLQENKQRLAAMIKGRSFFNEDFEMVATEEEMNAYQEAFPDFFYETERVPLDNNNYRFKGDLSIFIPQKKLSSVAWENAKSLDVLHMIEYDQAYLFQSVYSFQEQVQKESTENLEYFRQLLEQGDKSTPEQLFDKLINRIELAIDFDDILIKTYDHLLDEIGVPKPELTES